MTFHDDNKTPSLGEGFTFHKYHGAGNDFILIENQDLRFPLEQKKLIPALCDRFTGIGADGLLLLEPSLSSDIKMRIFNSDGSEASMCGNGLRCVVLHASQPGSKMLSIETLAGKSYGVREKTLFRVSLPKSEIVASPLPLEEGYMGHLVDTGTPHLVIFTDDLSNSHFTKVSNLFRNRDLNINLAKISEGHTHVRTFEKGVYRETLACGSGGAAVALILKKFSPHVGQINIVFQRNTLSYYLNERGVLWMEGPALKVYQGKFCLKNFI